MKNIIKNSLLEVIQHKNFYYVISIALSGGLLYYSYTYHIEQSLVNIKMIKANIGSFKGKKLEEDISQLKIRKKDLQKEYEQLLFKKQKNEEEMYQEVYDVVVDVMNKLNNSSFNIYKYELNDEYNEIELEMNGSYLNLIKLFDYLQTIKANVTIDSYDVKLENDKMLIALKLKVGILKI